MMNHLQRLLTLFAFVPLILNQAFAQSGERWYHYINEKNVAIQGYDPVAYQVKDKAEKGKDNIRTDYKGVTYLFSSEQHKQTFTQNPEKYLPAYGGWCTFFMGIDQETTGFAPTRMIPDPESFKVIQGKVHLFRKTAAQDFKTAFESADSPAILKRAEAFWATRLALAENTTNRPKGLNPMARMENLDWLPFMGKWEAKVHWWSDTTGTNKANFNGEWEFNYGYEGFCVMDDFKSIPEQPYAGTANGPAVRGYDVQNQEWHMTYIPVNQPRAATWLMTGKFQGPGHLEGTLETQDPYGNDILQKVVFKQVDEDHFQWRAHWSWDGGKTWKENAGAAECKRVK